MNIKNIKILLTNGPDEIMVQTDLPCPFVKKALPSQPDMSFCIKASYDTGEHYVRHVFNLEPEIVNVRA